MSEKTKTKAEKAPKRDAERTRKAILQAALIEYSDHGFSGARIDRIAKNANISKPMIYDYFGDKDALYAAALRETYVQIRDGERELHLDELDPETAICRLVHFTMGHFRENPWFISMLNTENLRGGATVREIHDANEIQSPLVQKLSELLKQGAADGVFRDDVDAVGLYIHIASLCYFPVSNAHTLRAVFDAPIDGPWLNQHVSEASEMILRFLKVEH